VLEAPEPKAGDASIGGEPGALLLVSSQYGSNTPEVTAAVEGALEELRPAVTSARMKLHPNLFRPASFIDTAVDNMSASLLTGAALVAAVLFVFLYNLRTGLISITAIPLSLLMAVIVLHHFGQSLNTLTLGGLAIAIGEVVDDAIIDVENIFRRLREIPPAERRNKLFQIVLDASIEVRSAVVYATFIVALVFLPVLTLSGIQGSLFAPLGIAYILAILASLVVALTVTPALSYLLLPKAADSSRVPGYVTWLKASYERLLRRISNQRGLVVTAAAVLIACAFTVVPFLGGEFLPELREGHFIVHMAMAPGSSLRESMRLGGLVTRDLLENPNVASVAQQAGRAELFYDTWGPHYSEIHVDLKPLAGTEAELMEDEIREVVERFPGAVFSTKTFLTERIEEVVSGSTAEVVIKVFGEDLELAFGP
jgi:Cu/Ag efflux pump CusA